MKRIPAKATPKQFEKYAGPFLSRAERGF